MSDVPNFLFGHLTGQAAVDQPAVVLGQPGSGKSVLTEVLAAELPESDFLMVRVELRKVHADSSVQQQIERALYQMLGEAVTWPELVRRAGPALPGWRTLRWRARVSLTKRRRRDSIAKAVSQPSLSQDQFQKGPSVVTASTARRYALVGAGLRARMYVDAIVGEHRDVAQLVAIADTNPGRLAAHAEWIAERGGPVPACFDADQLAQLIREQSVDRVIVTSPDFTHAGHVVAALEAGADVIVEKPLVIDEAGAAAISSAVERTGRNVTVTFNYRYSPRNSALRAVVASGTIGRPIAVHFEWMLDTRHGADYFRRWHRDKRNSGGLLIHKASHHFDLVNWWIDDVPQRVFASGGLRFYGDQGGGAPSGPRPERGSVDAAAGDPFALDLRRDPVLSRLYLDAETNDGYIRDRDVFSPGITIEDTLSLVVDYQGGASMSYSLTASAPWEGYNVAITGTEGRVELNVVERAAVAAVDTIDPGTASEPAAYAGVRGDGQRLIVQRLWETARQVEIEDDGGDHGGGDSRMLRELFRGAGSDPLGRHAGYLDGLRSIAVGIAGNRSLATGAPVLTGDLALGAGIERS